MKTFFQTCLLTGLFFSSDAQPLPGFKATGIFDEQEINITDRLENVRININAPLQFNRKGTTYLVFYALPNGNTIEWTKGSKLKTGDDWHFDIQHIAAQTRFVKNLDKRNNYVVAYLMADQKSWPVWKRTTANSLILIKSMIDSITDIFKSYSPKLVLNGHSGGGSFIFGFLDAVEEIPANIERIAFIDSDYGYEEGIHTTKLINWLSKKNSNSLVVLAYNDSIVTYNGKPVVSPTGGTWYRSRLMQRNLSEFFMFSTFSDTSFITHQALNGRILFKLKENPARHIYHTEQVARNGFILSLLFASHFDRSKYFTYFGDRVYEQFIGN
jgi:hypothetical protein